MASSSEEAVIVVVLGRLVRAPLPELGEEDPEWMSSDCEAEGEFVEVL